MIPRDVHILLSVTDRPRFRDHVYEIVIGAGRNSFSTVRTRVVRCRVASHREANILSMLEPGPIEIIQMKVTYLPSIVHIIYLLENFILNANGILFPCYMPIYWFSYPAIRKHL